MSGEPNPALVLNTTPEYPIKHTGYFTRPQFWALDEACKPIREAFSDYGPYLVGSVMETPHYRDVDVRLILKDKRYDRLKDDQWSLLSFIISRHLEAVTGLPIDFQVQRQTEANAAYPDKFRNPLGVRSIGVHWVGDGRPEPRPVDWRVYPTGQPHTDTTATTGAEG